MIVYVSLILEETFAYITVGSIECTTFAILVIFVVKFVTFQSFRGVHHTIETECYVKVAEFLVGAQREVKTTASVLVIIDPGHESGIAA